MAIVGSQVLTLKDWASRMEPDGKVATIVEILQLTNEILDDMMWRESNSATGHRVTIRSGLPPVAWRLLNYGVPQGKSTTIQVTDSIGMLEAYGEVDKSLADLNGNTKEFRLTEDKAFIEAMSQDMAVTLFYGNTAATPQRFNGLATRYSSLSAENGENIIDAGGTGSTNTSIWLVVWGDSTAYGLFPKGQITGLQSTDKGQQTLIDPDGGKYEGYRAHYKWDAGLTLKNWKYVVRIANIDVTALTKDGSGSSADLIDLMVQAIEQVPSTGAGRPVFYCNKTIRSFLRRQITNKDNVFLRMDEVAGRKAVVFDDIPVRKVEAIVDDEERVV